MPPQAQSRAGSIFYFCSAMSLVIRLLFSRLRGLPGSVLRRLIAAALRGRGIPILRRLTAAVFGGLPGFVLRSLSAAALRGRLAAHIPRTAVHAAGSVNQAVHSDFCFRIAVFYRIALPLHQFGAAEQNAVVLCFRRKGYQRIARGVQQFNRTACWRLTVRSMTPCSEELLKFCAICEDPAAAKIPPVIFASPA